MYCSSQTNYYLFILLFFTVKGVIRTSGDHTSKFAQGFKYFLVDRVTYIIQTTQRDSIKDPRFNNNWNIPVKLQLRTYQKKPLLIWTVKMETYWFSHQHNNSEYLKTKYIIDFSLPNNNNKKTQYFYSNKIEVNSYVFYKRRFKVVCLIIALDYSLLPSLINV